MSEQVTATLRDLNARPLGVRPDVPLTDAELTALQRLEDYDLAPVRARLLNRGVLPAERIDDAIFEFRRFLGLAVVGYDRRLAVVGVAVDEVWHTCLLFTRLYADLCDQTVGHFVHHEPLMGETEDYARLLEGERMFERAYSRVYGEMTALQALIELTDEQLAGVVGGGGKSGSVLCDQGTPPGRPSLR
ncbi:MAG TPA: hypothetical protein VII06_26700 [Chloroflexota bacterium]